MVARIQAVTRPMIIIPYNTSCLVIGNALVSKIVFMFRRFRTMFPSTVDHIIILGLMTVHEVTMLESVGHSALLHQGGAHPIGIKPRAARPQ